MSFSSSFLNNMMTSYAKNWGWFLGIGIVFIILGLVAISLATMTTLISVIFIGAFLFISGVFLLVDAFKFWWRRWWGFLLHLIIGCLYILAGLYLMTQPVLASVSLTLLLGVFYLIAGVIRIIYSLSMRMRVWGWSLLSGLVSLLLGILILASWPMSGLYILGLFVGIDLLFFGWTYVMIALTSKRLTV